MSKTWLDKQNTKTRANAQEKKLSQELGARLTANSGATPLSKGDMVLGDLLIESKATDKESISLRKEWLEKIEQEALRTGKTPVVILEIGNRRYWVMRESDIK